MTQDPIQTISLGAGVQSSTMSLMAGCGELGPMPDAAIFADTKAEPASVYKWLKWLKKQLPFPTYTVSAGSLTTASLTMHVTHDGRAYSRTSIPFFTRNNDGSQGKIKFRGCTRDFKLKPLHSKQRELIVDRLPDWKRQHKAALTVLREAKKTEQKRRHAARYQSDDLFLFSHNEELVIRTLANETEAEEVTNRALGVRQAWDECQADPLVVSWIGISLDEASRMKPSREPWILHRYPLVDARISRKDCLAWMEAHGYPVPPRSACVYCPFHNNAEWIRLRDEEPKEFRKAARFEKQLQETKAKSSNFRTTPYLHRSLVQLTHVDLRSEAEMGQINFFENDCEGLCGT